MILAALLSMQRIGFPQISLAVLNVVGRDTAPAARFAVDASVPLAIIGGLLNRETDGHVSLNAAQLCRSYGRRARCDRMPAEPRAAQGQVAGGRGRVLPRRSKNSSSSNEAIPGATREIVVQLPASLPRLHDNSYVLPGARDGGHLMGLHKAWRRVQAAAKLEGSRRGIMVLLGTMQAARTLLCRP
jgi:hypothetical protein